MKIFKLTLLLIFNTWVTQGQIKNNDFEISHDTLPTEPNDWYTMPIAGYRYSLDSEIKYTGLKSFTIKSTQEIDTNKYIPFSQIVEIDIQTLKRIAITAFIKTTNIRGNVGLWCQIWDKDNKKIGFENLEIQKTKIVGTNDWKKYSLILTVNNKAKKLVFGGYLQGMGIVWYDSFAIENMNNNDPPSNDVKKYIKKFNKIVKNNSIYSDSLDWNKINKDIDILSKGLKTKEDAHVLTNYVLTKLGEAGDHHSTFVNKIEAEKSSTQNTDGRQPAAKLLENNIGYIYVPGFQTMNDTVSLNFANKIQALIRDLDSKNSITGWIVDLRENTGGSGYPMIAGLGPLIGEGTLGYFIFPKAKKSYKWYYSNGIVGAKNVNVLKIKTPYTLKNQNIKIAVLIGSNTASSGEMTAISFIGKPNVKFFGQPSGGYTTGNSGYKLSDGSYLALSVCFEADRNNKKYLNKISPDFFVDEKDDNKTILTAKNWLNGK